MQLHFEKSSTTRWENAHYRPPSLTRSLRKGLREALQQSAATRCSTWPQDACVDRPRTQANISGIFLHACVSSRSKHTSKYSICESMGSIKLIPSTHQSTNQPSNKPTINQQTNQPTNPSIKQSTKQPINQ